MQAQHLARWIQGNQESGAQVQILCRSPPQIQGVTLFDAGYCRKGETVCSLCSDDWVLVVGMTDGLAKVYSIDTLAFITLLNCRHDQ